MRISDTITNRTVRNNSLPDRPKRTRRGAAATRAWVRSSATFTSSCPPHYLRRQDGDDATRVRARQNRLKWRFLSARRIDGPGGLPYKPAKSRANRHDRPASRTARHFRRIPLGANQERSVKRTYQPSK